MRLYHKAVKMLSHDLSAGLRQQSFFFLVTVLFVLTACFAWDGKFLRWCDFTGCAAQKPGVCDYLVFLLEGMEPHDFNRSNGFRFPAIWMMFFVLFLISVARYAKSDMYGIGQQLLLKSGSRDLWWFSKMVWAFASAALYYSVIVVTVMLYLTARHGFRWSCTDFTASLVPGVAELSLAEQMLWLLAIPVLTLCVIGSMEILIEVLVSPVVGVAAILALLLAALYFNLQIVPGGTCILLHSELAGSGGFALTQALIFPVLLQLICSTLGHLIFRRFDLLGNHEV